MSLKLVAGDFHHLEHNGEDLGTAIATRANLLFNAWLEQQPLLYSMSESALGYDSLWVDEARYQSCSDQAKVAVKRTARLVDIIDIKPLEKPKPCKHDPVMNALTMEWKCWECKKRLAPTGWEEVK